MSNQKAESGPWYSSVPLLMLCCLFLPPVGLVLLWMRPNTTLGNRIAGSLWIIPITLAHLFLLFGLRVEMDGSGARPIFTFRNKERHYQEIESSRNQQAAMPQPPPVVEAAAPAPEPAAPAPAAAPAAAPTTGSRYWTDYRGPQRDGRYTQGEILTSWPAKGLARLWKQPIGGGYASMVIADGKLFTIDQRRDQEVVAAYDVKTGKEVWAHSYAANFQESMGGDGPRATPTWQEGVLYSLGATGELRVLDANTGAVKWQKNILTDNQTENLTWGMSSAPLLVDDKVIVQPGGIPGKSIVAYNKATGAPVWRVLDDKQAYTSPMLVTLAGRRQIVTATAQRVIGLTPEEGKVLWEYPWTTEYDVNAAQPVIVGDNRLVISAGYDHGAALVEISGSGDKQQCKEIWMNKRMKNKFNSSVLYDGHLYGMDESIMACVRVSDGQQMWKGGRYGYGQMLLAGSHIVVITESGEVALVQANPQKHTELAKFQAIEGKTWNVPAMADGVLYVRNLAEMAAFRISK